MDKKRFHGIACTGPIDLGIEGNGNGHSHIGLFIHISMADTGSGFDNRHRGAAYNRADKSCTAAGNDHIDKTVEMDQFRDRFPLWNIDKLDGAFGKTGLAACCNEGIAYSLIGMEGFPAPFKITALPLFTQSAMASAVTLGRAS